MNIFGKVTISAEELILILRKALFTEPRIEDNTTTNFTAMIIPSTIYMVYGQNFWSILITTCALGTICRKNLITKIFTPKSTVLNFFRCRIRTVGEKSENILQPVAILTKQLKTFTRKVILTQPEIELITTKTSATMLRSIIIHMVNREESRIALTTIYTYTTIGTNNLIAKSITTLFSRLILSITIFSMILTRTRTTLITQMSRLNRTRETSTTNVWISLSTSCILALIVTIKNRSLLFWGLFKKQFTLPLGRFLVVFWVFFEVSNIAIMATRLTEIAQTVLLIAALLTKAITIKPLLTDWAKLLIRRDIINLKNNIINRLKVQCAEIKSALNQVLRYTRHTEETKPFFRRPRMLPVLMAQTSVQHCGASSCFIPLVYHANTSMSTNVADGTNFMSCAIKLYEVTLWYRIKAS